MKKQMGSLLFCLLFLLICLTPLAAMVVLGPSQAGSNEVLVGAPKLREKDGGLNEDYLSDLAAYVRDRFGLRQELITANAKLTAAVFRESATEKVILGEDGWLYYAETLADYEGTAPMTDRQLWNAAHTLAMMQEYAASRGAELVFTVAPNKNTLYPAYMPERYSPLCGDSNLERLQAALKAEQVSYCDLLAVLSAETAPVYYRTDSHWDGYGSALAHDALLQTLGRSGTLAKENFLDAAHRGDLTEMLYPASAELEYGPALARERSFSYVGNVRGVDDMMIRTTSQTGVGSLVMFRDSFGNTLHADLAESFAAACFSRAMPYDLTLLEKEQADVLILEIVERNILDLAEKAPLMEAPVRELTASEWASVQLAASATVRWESDSSRLENCVKYTGVVDDPEMDLDSPIYLVLDGTAYEATPAGDGEYAFTMYGPAAETVEILFRCGGKWMCRGQ